MWPNWCKSFQSWMSKRLRMIFSSEAWARRGKVVERLRADGCENSGWLLPLYPLRYTEAARLQEERWDILRESCSPPEPRVSCTGRLPPCSWNKPLSKIIFKFDVYAHSHNHVDFTIVKLLKNSRLRMKIKVYVAEFRQRNSACTRIPKCKTKQPRWRAKTKPQNQALRRS